MLVQTTSDAPDIEKARLGLLAQPPPVVGVKSMSRLCDQLASAHMASEEQRQACWIRAD